MSAFIISTSTGARHLVAGDLSELAPRDAWRKPENTACGRSLVPLNYFKGESLNEVGHACQQCLRRGGVE
jgi:hypothetical protein